MSGRRTPERRPPRRSSWPFRLLVVAGILAVFLLGIAFGQALDDGPPPPSTETYVRTLTTPDMQSGTSTGP